MYVHCISSICVIKVDAAICISFCASAVVCPLQTCIPQRAPFSFFRLAIGSDFEEAYRVSFIHSFCSLLSGGDFRLAFFLLSISSIGLASRARSQLLGRRGRACLKLMVEHDFILSFSDSGAVDAGIDCLPRLCLRYRRR